jgi:hypothetical protein
MADDFSNFSDGPQLPSRHPFAIVPHDSNPLTRVTKAIYVGSGGTVVLRAVDGQADVTFRNLGDGQILPVRAAFVRASGTTAGDLIGFA